MSKNFSSQKKYIRSSLIALMCLYFIGCSSSPVLDVNKWQIEANASQETLNFIPKMINLQLFQIGL